MTEIPSWRRRGLGDLPRGGPDQQRGREEASLGSEIHLDVASSDGTAMGESAWGRSGAGIGIPSGRKQRGRQDLVKARAVRALGRQQRQANENGMGRAAGVWIGFADLFLHVGPIAL